MSVRHLRATAVYTLLNLFPVAIGFLLLPIYTRYLSVEEYGVIVLAAITQATLVIFVGFTFDRAVPRLLFDAPKGSKRRKELLGQILTAGLLFAVIVGVLLVLVGPYIFQVVWKGRLPFAQYGWIVFSTAVITTLNQMVFQYQRTRENITGAAAISLLPYFLSLVGSLWGIIGFQGGAWESLLGKSLGMGLGTLPLLIPIFWQVGLIWRRKMFYELVQYCTPLFLFALVYLAGESVDRFLLNRLLSFEDLSLYGFAFTITLPATLLLVGYNHAAHPSVAQALTQKTPGATQLAARFFQNITALSLFSFAVFLGLVFPLIDLIAGPDYGQAKRYIPFLAFLILGRAGDMIFTFYQYQEKRTRFLPVTQLMYLALAIGFILMLSPPLGAYGVALAIAIIQLPMLLIRYLFERRVTSALPSLRSMVGLYLFCYALVGFNDLVADRRWGLSMTWVQGAEAFVIVAYLAIRHRDDFRSWVKH